MIGSSRSILLLRERLIMFCADSISQPLERVVLNTADPLQLVTSHTQSRVLLK